MGRPACLSLLIAVLLLAFAAEPRAAETKPAGAGVSKPRKVKDDDAALIRADSITYDDVLGFIVARGNVEIVRGDRVLMADTLTYSERDDIATASGNVVMIEPNGNVLFADHMELKDGLKNGTIEQLRILWNDDMRFAMERAELYADKGKRFTNVVLSPCKLCQEDPTRAPLWQIKSGEVIHDEVDQYLHLYDVWLEMYGVPVFYSPYLAFPDPTLKRRTGFLTPSFGFGGNLGFTVQTPYFWNIAPNIDVTFSPMVTINEGPVMFAEYRHHFGDGIIEVNGSGTYVDALEDDDGDLIHGELRGHISGYGEFDINNNFRWGFNVNRATDKRYLRDYGLSSPSTLISDAYIEGFDNRSYVSAKTIFFQGQRSDDQSGDTPIVAPVLDLNFVGDSTVLGGRWSVDASLLNIIRTDSADTFRLSLGGEWVLPHTFENGQIVTLTASALGQLYIADILDDPDAPFGPSHQVTTGRFFPQVMAEWRYPWARRSGTTQQVLEPVLAVSIAPPDPNFGEIPNEDSIDLVFSDANLFSANRIPGMDRFEGGMRVVYGLNAGVYGDGGGFSSLFFGQSYRIFGDTMFPTNSGLEDSFSDYVGRLQIQPLSWASVTARARFDKDDFSARVIEIDSQFNFGAYDFGIDYIFIDEVGGAVALPLKEQLTVDFGIQISDRWRVEGRHRQDLAEGVPLRSDLGFFYADECFEIDLRYQRRFFGDDDFAGDNRFTINLTFKNLGEIGTSL